MEIDRSDFDKSTNQDQTDRVISNMKIPGIIPVIEEQLHVSREVKETGKVRITKTVHHEDVTVDDLIVHEEVEVERIALNKYVEAAPESVRYEGDKMIISVLREVTVVEKRLLLVEELHVTKRKVETQLPHQVTLRKEEVTVERVAIEDQSPPVV